MESIPLSDLAAIVGATVGPMLLFATAIMRYMHVDSTKTRDLIERTGKENRDLIERARTETREDNRETRDLIEKTRDQVKDGRERLARIEGHLGTWPPPEDETQPGDAKAA